MPPITHTRCITQQPGIALSCEFSWAIELSDKYTDKPGESTESLSYMWRRDGGRGKKQICKLIGITTCIITFSGKGQLLIASKRCIGLIWFFSYSPPEKERHELVWLVEWDRILRRIKCVSMRRCEWKRKWNITIVEITCLVECGRKRHVRSLVLW